MLPQYKQKIIMDLGLAADNAISSLSNTYKIRSGNNIFNPFRAQDALKVESIRHKACHANNLAMLTHLSKTYGVGNCFEKSLICYSSLINDLHIQKINYETTICRALNFDHCFIVVSIENITGVAKIKELDKTCLIVDGWTKDWYFPNLPFKSLFKHLGLKAILPNPRQFIIRQKVVHSLLTELRQ